jgi:chromosome condensin MukBEF ATPase and DNA-binding subunit MukB
MPAKRRSRPKPIPRIRLRKGSAINVTRAEFEAVIKLLNQRVQIINEMRNELRETCRDVASQVDKNRQALEIQFTRIAQLQQEIDALKRRA